MAFRIVGVDHGSKEDLVKECGAEAFIDITKFDDKTLPEEVKRITGGKIQLGHIQIYTLTIIRSWCISSNCVHSK